MAHRLDRVVGEDFTNVERQLLTLLCSGDGVEFERARTQLVMASWGGCEFEECDCFLIHVEPDGAARIEHDGGPLATADVWGDGGSIGTLELWVVDGRLHSVNFMPWGDDHVELPDPSKYRIAL